MIASNLIGNAVNEHIAKTVNKYFIANNYYGMKNNTSSTTVVLQFDI